MKRSKVIKIVLTGGGTGGHIFPLLAVARSLKTGGLKRLEFSYLGPRDQWAERSLAAEDIRMKKIWAGKWRRSWEIKSILLNALDLFKSFLGIGQAFFYLLSDRPTLIFSKGGYGSLPVGIAAKVLKIPLFLHESDSVPGIANQLLGRFAQKIFISFPQTPFFDSQKTILTGNPIRETIFLALPEKTLPSLFLTNEKPILLILGGSQGSQRINDLILLILPQLLEDFEIIHQCGKNNFQQVRSEARAITPKRLEKYYHLFPFLEEKEYAFSLQRSRVVISRSGSGTIFEIACSQKPSFLIPLPEAAQDHQLKNSYSYAATGATTVIEEANLRPHFFLEQLRALMADSQKLEKMKNAAKEFARPQAAEAISQQLLEYLEKP